MLKKLKLFVIITIIFVLALPLNACQRLSGRAENVIEENEENRNKGNIEEESTTIFPLTEDNDILIPAVKNNGFDVTYGFTDKTGSFVIEPRFKSVEPFFESGIAPVTDFSG